MPKIPETLHSLLYSTVLHFGISRDPTDEHSGIPAAESTRQTEDECLTSSKEDSSSFLQGEKSTTLKVSMAEKPTTPEVYSDRVHLMESISGRRYGFKILSMPTKYLKKKLQIEYVMYPL